MNEEIPKRRSKPLRRLTAVAGTVGLCIAGLFGGLAATQENSALLLCACVACFGISIILFAFSVRFTIRDLLWLALVVALVVGWVIDHTHLECEIDLLLHPISGGGF
jgi:hypothetical protein